jgi:DHA3 family macrolide efflux protein-like MFS transporter
MLAIPWYFTDSLGKPELFGWIFAAVTLGTLFWSLYAGTLIDRFSRKLVLIGMNGIGLLLVGGIALFAKVQGELPLFFIGVAFALTVFNFNLHYPSLYAFAQEISGKGHYARTNSLIEIQGQSTRMVASAFAALLLAGTGAGGPILGAVLPFSFASWELTDLLVLDAIAYGVTLLFLLPIRYRRVEERLIDQGSIGQRVRTGFRFLKAHPKLFHFGNASFIIFLFVLVQAYFLMPVYIKDHLGMQADVYGIGEALFALGAIGAGVYVRRLMRHLHSVPSIVVAMLLSGAIFILCALTRSFWIFMGFNLLLGVSNSATRVMRITYLFEKVPNGVIGRVNSVFQAINILLRTFFTGLFALPFFSGEEGILFAYFLSGVVILLGAIPLVVHRKALMDLQMEEDRPGEALEGDPKR